MYKTDKVTNKNLNSVFIKIHFEHKMYFIDKLEAWYMN